MGSQDTRRGVRLAETLEATPTQEGGAGELEEGAVGARGYPRPQLRRAGWQSLNGTWDFALDPLGRWAVPAEVGWSTRILVPFAPEAQRSGVEDTSFYRACWYRRTFEPPALKPQERLVLHFGAVDYATTVWINGSRCACQEGGYTPFQVDITDLLHHEGPQELVVRAEDDPADLAKPRGKQDWQLEPHSIWYPRTTGIWQTVWLERVPTSHDVRAPRPRPTALARMAHALATRGGLEHPVLASPGVFRGGG
jgi:hypothetical protein